MSEVKRYYYNVFSKEVAEDTEPAVPSEDSRRFVLLEDYAALKAERDALAAAYERMDWALTQEGLQVPDPTPEEVAAAIAEWKAQGAEACVDALLKSDDPDFNNAPHICAMVARSLRKGGAE